MRARRSRAVGHLFFNGLLGLVVYALFATTVHGADVNVQAQLDRTRVRVGESATLSVEVQGAKDVPAPELGDVDGLSVHYIGPATQISIINGRVRTSITHRFGVAPLQPGNFTIGPITIPYRGATLNAGSVTLRALAAGAPAGSGARASGRGAGNPPAAVPQGRQLRLTLITPKTTVYLHQRLPLVVSLSVGSVRVSDLQYPSVPGDGFALETFPEPGQRTERTADGTFQMVEFRTVLTPHRSGSLTVGPAKMAMNIVTSQRRGDPFFSSFFGGRRQPIELESEPVILNVLSLPTVGRPASFGGGVGRFTMDVAAAPRELVAGDPVTVTVTIRGRGNLAQVTPPSFESTDDLRTYPVQQTGGASAGTADVQERVFEQVVIPERDGTVTLPPLELDYFDPDAAAYRTVSSAPMALQVAARAASVALPRILGAAPASAPAEEKLGRDIVFIKDDPGRLVPVGSRLYRRAGFWLYQPLPLLVWLGVVLYDRRRRRLHGDAEYARFTRAGRAARRALADAEAALASGDRGTFYDRVTRAVSEYLAAKLALPPGGVSAETVAARLSDRQVTAAVAEEVRALFDTCERVRFAPDAAGDGDMKRTLEHATRIIRAVERERKLSVPTGTVAVIILLLAVASGVTAAVENPVALFFRGNALYSAERFADAATTYEQILDGGLESASLHFNIGNAYFKQGDIGRAVLGYERARRSAPRDPDLAANLTYAQTLTDDTDDTSLLATLLVPLATRMSSDELLWTTTIAYTVLMLLLIVMRLAPPLARLARMAALGGALVVAVAGTSAGYRIATVDLPHWAVLVGQDERSVRFEPSVSGTEHFRARPGRVLRILAERDAWAQVARRDGKRGWVELSSLVPL